MGELQSTVDGLYRLGFAGDTLNTAWYVRALTSPDQVSVDYLTAIGTDQLSSEMHNFLDENRIGTEYIKRISERTIGLYLITLDGAERSFTYWRSQSAARLLAEDPTLLRAALAKADTIYFSGITLAILSSEHRSNLLAVLKERQLDGATIVFDSNSRRKLWASDAAMMEAMTEAYKITTIALPTFEDERAVFGDRTPDDSMKRIADYGVSESVVKDGPNPCLVYAAGEHRFVSPAAVSGIVDTTGAGDSFNAGYIAAKLAGMTPTRAAEFAHLVAGRVICGRGALLEMTIFKDLAFG